MIAALILAPGFLAGLWYGREELPWACLLMGCWYAVALPYGIAYRIYEFLVELPPSRPGRTLQPLYA